MIRKNRRSRARRSVLNLLRLEDRTVPASFTVNSAIAAGSPGGDRGTAIAVDAAGNTYVAGFVGDGSPAAVPLATAGLGGGTLYPGAFVGKFDPAGTCLWAVNVGGGNSNVGGVGAAGLAVDAGGNLLVAGSFSGSVDFGPVTLTTASVGDIFVAKFDPAGTCLWATGGGGQWYDEASSVAVDPAGNAYVAGTFVGQASFGPYTVNPGNANAFVAKLDPGGNFLWVDGIGTPEGGDRGVRPNAIAVDAAGNAYVAGDYCGTIDFDPGPGTVTLSSANRRGGFPSTDAFVWKLNAAGGFGWAKSMGGSGWDGATAIAVDGAGGVYVTGTYGPLGWRNTDSNGNNDYDPGNGKLKLPLFGGTDVFVEKFDANGNMVWAKAVGGAGADAAAGIAVDGLGRVVVTGTFSGSADFNPGSATYSLTSQGGTDGFVLALDGAGGFLAAAAFGGAGDDAATAVAIGPAGRVRATGYFVGSATFGPFDLTSAGGSDLFLLDLTLV